MEGFNVNLVRFVALRAHIAFDEAAVFRHEQGEMHRCSVHVGNEAHVPEIVGQAAVRLGHHTFCESLGQMAKPPEFGMHEPCDVIPDRQHVRFGLAGHLDYNVPSADIDGEKQEK
jgi:hypothetical protein